MNSIRYTPDSGRINMDVAIKDDRLYFRICDTGKGFSPKDLAHIFDRFYRGDDARRSEGGHMGLGLYIAGKLVEAHGGAIKAFNLPEGGACIAFDIAVCK
ncbi:sensor histidine kinase [Thermoanaerobacterium sp. DL9XJH110]|uniref:sensor histidine kinase n=1 Tax=Thermoanaerobacterium sp. DL9XJH110 TaxID=3386643 RepID=UPI003BB57C41